MEVFGINGSEFLVILTVAVIVLGPDAITSAMRGLRNFIDSAKAFSAKLREETSEDLRATGLSDVDLSAFDLSELDPRQMIREAVQEEIAAWARETGATPPKRRPTTTKAADPSNPK
ncbi:Sec-independent protein translocase subunit TatA/TatB [Trueperella bialowiezensis]|uniref:Sec-independent translocase n=1 Tax=Trueperella bialowiezensis TaxID=312285 RepID=A0A3S4WF96_9ACTO|nr:translocase [Trueperella bialowiezensis]VEI12575.1 sec-independent translocase [Trueperella bialowiezensis]